MANPKKTPTQATDAPGPANAPAFPTVDIIERRIASGTRNVARPREYALINQHEPMVTRPINTAIEGRYYEATERLGWVPVKPEELAGGLEADMRAVDGRVVMGEHGKEVLMKMPAKDYRRILRSRAQTEHNDMTNRTKFRNRAVAAMEREAKGESRGGAEQLERASERLGHVEVEQFEVSTERVPILPAS